MCSVSNELYSGGLMTFRYLSILTASGRRVKSLSFVPTCEQAEHSISWEGDKGIWCFYHQEFI